MRKRKEIEETSTHEKGAALIFLSSSLADLEEKPWAEWSVIDGRLKEKTGFEKDEIDLIYLWCKDELVNFHGRKKIRHSSGAKFLPTLLSSHNLLLLALHSLWKNPTLDDLADTFKTPRATISETRERLYPILQRCLSHLICVPKSTRRFEDGPLKDVAFIIDTTPTPIPEPSSKADRKLYFNHKRKKGKYAMKTQAAVGLDLKFIVLAILVSLILDMI